MTQLYSHQVLFPILGKMWQLHLQEYITKGTISASLMEDMVKAHTHPFLISNSRLPPMHIAEGVMQHSGKFQLLFKLLINLRFQSHRPLLVTRVTPPPPPPLHLTFLWQTLCSRRQDVARPRPRSKSP